ncbi:hypothetical protein IFM89_018343 [Coptis chinensis]|uniref:Increased DNA methylation 1 C-terminal domain-containing protein n=1 Tax=Coptis chinensis TaxID=261450 RepID=A0A835IQW3_9MAGN|nr:hypothetical protein IFM89_018343 [Coptis chinensis]
MVSVSLEGEQKPDKENKDSTVVTVATLRIFGPEIAEIPLVAATSDNQGLGYFQSLFTCIERLLGFLNVKKLVLPSAEESKSIWTDKFGFKKIFLDQVSEYRNNYQMMTFHGTSMLQRPCEREYHVGCHKEHKMADLKWFCCTDCNRIHTALQKLVAHGPEKLPDSFLKVMLKKQQEKCPDNVAGFDVSWRILSGKMASLENKLLL